VGATGKARHSFPQQLAFPGGDPFHKSGGRTNKKGLFSALSQGSGWAWPRGKGLWMDTLYIHLLLPLPRSQGGTDFLTSWEGREAGTHIPQSPVLANPSRSHASRKGDRTRSGGRKQDKCHFSTSSVAWSHQIPTLGLTFIHLFKFLLRVCSVLGTVFSRGNPHPWRAEVLVGLMLCNK
jgi:hypothetical protein